MAETYEIVGQTPRTRVLPGGVTSSVVLVTYRTKPSGATGYVEVPASAFTPEEVDRLVSAQAAVHEAVAHL